MPLILLALLWPYRLIFLFKNFIGEGYADSYLTTTRLWPVSNIRVWPVGLFAETLVTWTVLSPLLTA